MFGIGTITPPPRKLNLTLATADLFDLAEVEGAARTAYGLDHERTGPVYTVAPPVHLDALGQ